MVPEIKKALHVFSTISATSCSSERSFSALRRIKNYVRNRIGQERLNNVSVLNIERLYANEVLKYDLDSVIDGFGQLSNRRTKLLF